MSPWGARDDAACQANQSQIRAYLETLSPQKRVEVEVAAVSANPLGLVRISPRIGQTIIDKYVLDILEARLTAPKG
jgi:hypothetical protein